MGVFGFLKKKKGLLEPEASPLKRMGIPEDPIHEDVEAGFDRRVPIIFPTRSPINSLAGPPEETKSAEEMIPKYSGKFMKRLLESKRDLDDVYSRGYFENHYPEADKQMKQFLHDKTMTVWAKALKEKTSHEEEEKEDKNKEPNITIIVNVNK